MPRLSSWKESPSGRVEPSGGFFFCLSLKICEFMVFKVEKSVFKNAVAVYFQYTKKKFNNYNARYVRVRIRASARRAGRGRRNPRGGLTRSYGTEARLRENSFSVQKNCTLNAEGLSPYRHQFILTGYARANKQNPRPPCRFSVFLHACSVPLRWGERAFFWSFPGGSPAARAVSRGKARRDPPFFLITKIYMWSMCRKLKKYLTAIYCYLFFIINTISCGIIEWVVHGIQKVAGSIPTTSTKSAVFSLFLGNSRLFSCLFWWFFGKRNFVYPVKSVRLGVKNSVQLR